MPIARSAALLAAFLAMALLVVVCAPQGLVAVARGADTVDELKRQATDARKDLEKATKEWEDRREELAKSQEQLRGTLKELNKAESELDRVRGPVARLANMAYQQPGAAGSMALFGSDDTAQTLRLATDMSVMAGSRQVLIDKAGELQKRQQKLASTVQELQAGNAVEQTRLQQQIDALKTRSAQLTAQLTQMLNNLDLSRDKRLELGCDKELVADARKFPNGLIPSKYLCKLPQKGEYLRADSALAFYKLNAAYKKAFGRDMCVRDSYRSLSNQQRIYYQRPGFAAVPGRSNHGLGTAVDLCGGVENSGSSQFNWLEAHSRKYNWFHPQWAYSSPFEPWHWEFDAK